MRLALAYNVAVGAAGLVSLGMAYLVKVVPPGGLRMPFSWVPITVFAVMASVCYLFGPATELFIEKLWGPRVLLTGPVLFRIGLTFPVGLGRFPTLMTVFGWVFRIVFSIF